MRWRKVAVCVAVFSLMGGSMMFADSVTQKIRVWSNGKEIADGGYLIDGKTYIPAREAGGVVLWDDSGKVTIIKPNVHMFMFKGDTVFGNVKPGKVKFKVFTQVDNLTSEIASVKVTIMDPAGNVKDIDEQDVSGSLKEDFWWTTKEITYEFKDTGKYRVGYYIKPSKNADYTLVSEKIISAQN
ncbi:copper amine oxidase [Paenibacillus sp. CN-4]|uniref:copper amine oxidase n=1 Tax=Paenibacillus nanchangensis TaxID=3348343 RepID=UPI00397BFE9F